MVGASCGGKGLKITVYLRAPNEEDTARLLEEKKARGFPGMLGSIDWMHWSQKNYPTAWHGQFKGHKIGRASCRERVYVLV